MFIASGHFKIKASNSKKVQCTLNKLGRALNSIHESESIKFLALQILK